MGDYVPMSARFIHLQAFVTVAKEGSFSQAAKRLYITPTSLIQQISLLERELGFTLFYRHNTGVTLSDSGKVFLEGSVKILELMEQTRKHAMAIAEGGNTLRLFLSDGAFSSVLESFTKQFPEINTHFVNIPYDGYDTGFEMLKSGELDIYDCEYMDSIHHKGLFFQKTYETELCAAVSFHHRLAESVAITLDDLSDETVVLYEYLPTPYALLRHEDRLHDLQIQNTSYSTTEMLNGMQNGKVYLTERSWANSLLPFCKLLPIQPCIPISYGVAYARRTDAINGFLTILRQHVEGGRFIPSPIVSIQI